ncbi:Methionine aminopeptidase 2 [compost metagenome]
MTIDSQKDIDALRAVGRVVALTIAEMKKKTKAGMTTGELDDIGRQILARYGANSAPKKDVNFPGYTCISINDEVAHGIPGSRVIQAGDLVNIDVSAELDGYYADAGQSFQLPPYNTKIVDLCQYTHDTMMKVINSLKAGTKLNQVGKIIEFEARKGGYQVVKNLCSHGVGKALHEKPFEILPYYNPHLTTVLKLGQVITIEPFLSTGAEYVVEQPDGWTLKVQDKSYVAQHEHTIIITKDRPIIVTSA